MSSDDRDARRHFSKRERIALYLAADGRSELSGLPLGDDWHADHVKPWSIGGTTTMDNVQALTAAENLSKGAFSIMSVLTRSWQQQFFKTYQEHNEDDFLLAALPAAGKTRAALAVAHDWLKFEPARRLIIVTPTLNIRQQWKDEARNTFGVQLLTTKFSSHLDDPAFHGVVTTYHTIATSVPLFKRLCNKHQCMVIFDEIHHAGDHASWGRGLRESFETAAKRLALSGTPFRSDGEKIPFLKIDTDGSYRIDFRYDYPAAFRDGVIRELCFHRYGGSATFQVNDETFTLHTDDKLSEDEAARRLRALLGSRNFMRGLLAAAHDRLIEVRRAKPDAGGLVLCQTADHAVWVQGLLRDIAKQEPALIVSDGDLATSTVDDFRKNESRMWAVAVRQVSEGVDIRRLMVLAYATNWRTSLFFRQAVGRIMRSEGTDYDTEAYCFIPQDPELVSHAETIEAFQAEVIAERDPEPPKGGGGLGEQPLFSVLDSSDAEFDGLTNRGLHHDQPHSNEIIEFARRHRVPEATAATILQEQKMMLQAVGAAPADAPPDNEAEVAKLARQCNKKVNRLARARNCEQREIHREWIKISNCGHGRMTLLQFREKSAWLDQQLEAVGWK